MTYFVRYDNFLKSLMLTQTSASAEQIGLQEDKVVDLETYQVDYRNWASHYDRCDRGARACSCIPGNDLSYCIVSSDRSLSEQIRSHQ